jgi:hypothetical protein
VSAGPGEKPDERHRQRGQSLVEFAVMVPVFILCLLGMLEFGLAFNHHMTIEYATREGSRTGSALADGGSTNCLAGVDLDNIDDQIIGAVQRILKSPGSPINLAGVEELRIYRADATGSQAGSDVNVWQYTPNTGPDLDPGLAVDRLDFSPTSVRWPVCSRNSGPNPDSIGVRIRYRYGFQTPLGGIAGMFTSAPATLLTLDDRTVMALNPQT